MALAYADINIEIREISLKDRPQELYTVSKKGTVPVLITADNIVIDESLEIMLWGLKNHSSQSWLSNYSKIEIAMIDKNDNIFKKWLDKYKYHDRYPEHPREFYREHCNNILLEYEKQLDTTKYLLKDEISVVDIAIFPFIRQFANVDLVWFKSHYNQLSIWLDEICNSSLFISVMDKYDVWSNNASKNIINFNRD